MKKYFLSFSIGFVVAGIAVFSIMRYQAARTGDVSAAGRLIDAREMVEKTLRAISLDITERLAAFAQEAAADQQFSLRLIAENNPSAPEVAGMAGRFMKPMGFSMLAITDSAGVILSSGHFPANRGNRMQDRLSLLSDEPRVVEDVVVDRKMLTLQARKSFTSADEFLFCASGGRIVDEQFLGRIAPLPDVTVLLRQGVTIMGMQVKTISGIKNDSIIINDKEYPALEIPLAVSGDTPPTALVVVLMK